MVDIGGKTPTSRTAKAEGFIKFSSTEAVEQLQAGTNKKGDVLSVARVGGLCGLKKTAELVVLCHPGLQLSGAQIAVEIVSTTEVRVQCTVSCDGRTGVEMEAMVGASTALLNVYDMCKAVDKNMEISGLRVIMKAGGKHDFGPRPA